VRISILGVGFDNITMDQAISACLDLMKKGGYVATPNPEIVWLCRKDQQALSCINSADLLRMGSASYMQAEF
jgi:N-acetylglucosaminyldiphosphoundecaprenol N-acetyl-beta-D-mannosaminyltransferase